MNAFKKLVSGRLKAQAAGPHPDPEILAAFAEGSATDLERGRVFKHLSACTDCREIFYFAQASPEEVQQVLFASPKRPRFAMRWATLAASVIVLGSVVVTNRHLFTAHSSRSVEVEVNSPAPAPTARVALQSQPSTQPVSRVAATNAVVKTRPPAKHMTAKPQGSLQFDKSGEVHFAARSANQAQQFAEAQPATFTANQVSRAGLSPLWQVSSNGIPLRSLDGGQTWQAVSVQDGLVFRAINSLGHDVWAGGNSGALYHSADAGQNWTKIEPGSAGKRLESDVARISFTTPTSGTLTTANGEVWSTSDAGQTWQVK
jgi:hypothetical protein